MRKEKGFVGQFLIILFITAVIAAFLFYPFYKNRKEESVLTNVWKQMRFITAGMNVALYKNESFLSVYTTNSQGAPLQSWRVLLLPYLNEEALYRQIHLDEPWDSEWNRQFHDKTPACYRSPLHPNDPGCYFSVVSGERTLFPPPQSDQEGETQERITPEEFNGPYKHALCLVERKDPVCWMDPTSDFTVDQFIERTMAEEIEQGTWIDGARTLFPNKTNKETLRKLVERDDSIPLAPPMEKIGEVDTSNLQTPMELPPEFLDQMKEATQNKETPQE